MPAVEVISNVSHYYYTALSLHGIGYLQRYITGPSLLDDEAWISRCGPAFRRLWAERRLRGIPREAVRRLWLPEALQKSFARVGAPQLANRVCGELFAHRAAQIMGECDAIHFVHSVGWVAARKAKRDGIKVICDMREEHPQYQADILSEEAAHLGIDFRGTGSNYMQRVVEEIGLADYIFCPSSYAKRTFVERGISENKLLVCPYGVDAGQFTTTRREVQRKDFSVLFLGQLSMRKGVHYLLEAFRKAALPNAKLILAGPVDPAYRSVLDRYQGLFEETGRVPHSAVQDCYFGADVFVMPSLADSYGLVVSEAMSAGLPVIVSENTGMADFIRDGREGFVVPIRDSDAIADKLTFLYENRDLCAAMGSRGMATARSLDWNNYQSICANLYRSIFAAST